MTDDRYGVHIRHDYRYRCIGNTASKLSLRDEDD